MTFEKLGLSAPVLKAVAAEGYDMPTPIQTESIPHLLAGRDLLGCAQTGTGKTAAFALPILHLLGAVKPQGQGRRPIRTLILCPTRELAAQIGDSLKVYGRYTALRHAVIFGGVSQFHQVNALRAGVDIVVATPGRLLDLMNQGHVDLSGVSIFVLDEADRMFDMGFLPSLQKIVARVPKQRQTMLFSATMPPPIEQLANTILRNPTRLMMTPEKKTLDLIDQSIYHVPQTGKQQLLEQLLGDLPITRAIVFTRTKHGADRVVKQLDRAGFNSAAIHGNKSQSARQRALDAFKRGQLPVLVATDLAARGIDVDDITHVINFDLPNEAETYVHRVGRTGRAGASGIAISFCSADERDSLRDIERLTKQRLPANSFVLRPVPGRENVASASASDSSRVGAAQHPRGGVAGFQRQPAGNRPAGANRPAGVGRSRTSRNQATGNQTPRSQTPRSGRGARPARRSTAT
jgi:ATP-dependent RNA helicase RhlE